jgi:hypothetical protein
MMSGRTQTGGGGEVLSTGITLALIMAMVYALKPKDEPTPAQPPVLPPKR